MFGNVSGLGTCPPATTPVLRNQVHSAKLHDGRMVAVKIQYPGVAKGIESDVSNLLGMLNVYNLLPEGLFIDKVVKHMKVELRQECDYLREAACSERMRSLLARYPEYYVPEVVPELTTGTVFTNELIDGLTIDQCAELDQETRNRICLMFLKLLFRELFVHRYMQTDPNWGNFLYSTETGQVSHVQVEGTVHSAFPRGRRPHNFRRRFRVFLCSSSGTRVHFSSVVVGPSRLWSDERVPRLFRGQLLLHHRRRRQGPPGPGPRVLEGCGLPDRLRVQGKCFI